MSSPFLEEAAVWLAEAEVDLSAARALANSHPNVACFHAQQAAEKALNAVYLTHDVDFPQVHAISSLLDGVAAVHPELERYRSAAAVLNAYYIGTRYFVREIGAAPAATYTAENALDAISEAEAICGQCQQIYAQRLTRIKPEASEAQTPEAT
ncbi:MAG: HEPN domain-containing protein [Thermaerobacter sp.]|nr:HEPN domain-containing protein [Thermaerobacter sp.]